MFSIKSGLVKSTQSCVSAFWGSVHICRSSQLNWGCLHCWRVRGFAWTPHCLWREYGSQDLCSAVDQLCCESSHVVNLMKGRCSWVECYLTLYGLQCQADVKSMCYNFFKSLHKRLHLSTNELALSFSISSGHFVPSQLYYTSDNVALKMSEFSQLHLVLVKCWQLNEIDTVCALYHRCK